jgi:hypothetical protein
MLMIGKYLMLSLDFMEVQLLTFLQVQFLRYQWRD